MKRILSIALVSLVLGFSVAPVYEAMAAENMRDLSGTLSRLKNNPRYQGRILGTHIKRTNGGVLYEVRILRRDDRVILVYIDPETGGVVGDSEGRRAPRNKTKQNKPKRKKRKN
jgi:hypothetical protein